MLRSDLVQKIQSIYTTLSLSDIDKIIDLFLKKILKGLLNNQDIQFRGFGTFSKKINREKFVRNPKTNEKIYKKATYKIHFKIGKILHEDINKYNHLNNE